jgi:hypothetical protein
MTTDSITKRLAVLLAIVICAATAATASATVRTQSGAAPVSSQMALNWNSYAVDAVRSAVTLDGVPVGAAAVQLLLLAVATILRCGVRRASTGFRCASDGAS